MSYKELYNAWKKEKENRELRPLNKRFYAELSQYVRNLREEIQMTDEKTLKARLMSREDNNIRALLTSLIDCRYQKIFKTIQDGKQIPLESLTAEEEAVCRSMSSTKDELERILKEVLRGHAPQIREVRMVDKPKRILVRFLQAIPTIVGQDMKTYGPFKSEDIASLPAENAQILIKRGIVVEVDTQ